LYFRSQEIRFALVIFEVLAIERERLILRQAIRVVIPAYKAGESIKPLLEEISKYLPLAQVIVVDDGSHDKTFHRARSMGAVVLRHAVNLGKGAALRTGLKQAFTDERVEACIMMDADGQHDPKEIPRFLESLAKNDIALGIRRINKTMPSVLRFGNWFINQTIKFLYGVKIRDSQCGYRAFTSEAYKKLRWKAADYSMESEIIAKIGKYKLKYLEIPIETIYSDKYKGTTIIDGVKIVFNLLIWKLNSI
jgi:glycosyltransferase involved in cell wall biosynthesis